MSSSNVSDVPACHRCGCPPLFQWTRLASAAEAAVQRAEISVLQGRELSAEEVAARYGPLRVSVSGCADHSLGTHPAGRFRGAEMRALTHTQDCGGHGECECGEPL